MDARDLAAEQVALAGTLLVASLASLAYLGWRRHLAMLRALYLPAILIVVFGVPDALLTLRGNWAVPTREANPFIAAFLRWAGWRGLCLAFALWISGWTLALDGLETLQRRLPGRCGAWVRTAQLYMLYAVALGHLDGLTSWTHAPAAVYRASWGLLAELREHAAWSMPIFPLAYLLYPALTYAVLFTLVHGGIAGGARSMRRKATSALFPAPPI